MHLLAQVAVPMGDAEYATAAWKLSPLVRCNTFLTLPGGIQAVQDVLGQVLSACAHCQQTPDNQQARQTLLRDLLQLCHSLHSLCIHKATKSSTSHNPACLLPLALKCLQALLQPCNDGNSTTKQQENLLSINSSTHCVLKVLQSALQACIQQPYTPSPTVELACKAHSLPGVIAHGSTPPSHSCKQPAAHSMQHHGQQQASPQYTTAFNIRAPRMLHSDGEQQGDSWLSAQSSRPERGTTNSNNRELLASADRQALAHEGCLCNLADNVSTGWLDVVPAATQLLQCLQPSMAGVDQGMQDVVQALQHACSTTCKHAGRTGSACVRLRGYALQALELFSHDQPWLPAVRLHVTISWCTKQCQQELQDWWGSHAREDQSTVQVNYDGSDEGNVSRVASSLSLLALQLQCHAPATVFELVPVAQTLQACFSSTKRPLQIVQAGISATCRPVHVCMVLPLLRASAALAAAAKLAAASIPHAGHGALNSSFNEMIPCMWQTIQCCTGQATDQQECEAWACALQQLPAEQQQCAGVHALWALRNLTHLHRCQQCLLGAGPHCSGLGVVFAALKTDTSNAYVVPVCELLEALAEACPADLQPTLQQCGTLSVLVSTIASQDLDAQAAAVHALHAVLQRSDACIQRVLDAGIAPLLLQLAETLAMYQDTAGQEGHSARCQQATSSKAAGEDEASSKHNAGCNTSSACSDTAAFSPSPTLTDAQSKILQSNSRVRGVRGMPPTRELWTPVQTFPGCRHVDFQALETDEQQRQAAISGLIPAMHSLMQLLRCHVTRQARDVVLPVQLTPPMQCMSHTSRRHTDEDGAGTLPGTNSAAQVCLHKGYRERSSCGKDSGAMITAGRNHSVSGSQSSAGLQHTDFQPPSCKQGCASGPDVGALSPSGGTGPAMLATPHCTSLLANAAGGLSPGLQLAAAAAKQLLQRSNTGCKKQSCHGDSDTGFGMQQGARDATSDLWRRSCKAAMMGTDDKGGSNASASTAAYRSTQAQCSAVPLAQPAVLPNTKAQNWAAVSQTPAMQQLQLPQLSGRSTPLNSSSHEPLPALMCNQGSEFDTELESTHMSRPMRFQSHMASPVNMQALPDGSGIQFSSEVVVDGERMWVTSLVQQHSQAGHGQATGSRRTTYSFSDQVSPRTPRSPGHSTDCNATLGGVACVVRSSLVQPQSPDLKP